MACRGEGFSQINLLSVVPSSFLFRCAHLAIVAVDEVGIDVLANWRAVRLLHAHPCARIGQNVRVAVQLGFQREGKTKCKQAE